MRLRSFALDLRSGRNLRAVLCCFQSDIFPRHPSVRGISLLLFRVCALCYLFVVFNPKYQTSLAVMPDNKSLAGGGSSLFSGFRVLGLYSNHVPHAVRFHQKHREFYLVTAVGKSFHTYNVSTFAHISNYCTYYTADWRYYILSFCITTLVLW